MPTDSPEKKIRFKTAAKKRRRDNICRENKGGNETKPIINSDLIQTKFDPNILRFQIKQEIN